MRYRLFSWFSSDERWTARRVMIAVLARNAVTDGETRLWKLGAEQPLCFSYTAEYAPKNIRGRILALMQMIGGAFPWPVGILLALGFRDTIGWRGIWIVIGIGLMLLVIFRPQGILGNKKELAFGD